MSDILDIIGEHFTAKRSLTIPQWRGKDEKPVTIWWTPLSTEDQARVSRLSKAAGDDAAGYTLRVIVEKAEDESGNKLFTLESIPTLRNKADSTILSRLATAMLNPQSVEQAEKN